MFETENASGHPVGDEVKGQQSPECGFPLARCWRSPLFLHKPFLWFDHHNLSWKLPSVPPFSYLDSLNQVENCCQSPHLWTRPHKAIFIWGFVFFNNLSTNFSKPDAPLPRGCLVGSSWLWYRQWALYTKLHWANHLHTFTPRVSALLIAPKSTQPFGVWTCTTTM